MSLELKKDEHSKQALHVTSCEQIQGSVSIVLNQEFSFELQVALVREEESIHGIISSKQTHCEVIQSQVIGSKACNLHQRETFSFNLTVPSQVVPNFCFGYKPAVVFKVRHWLRVFVVLKDDKLKYLDFLGEPHLQRGA